MAPLTKARLEKKGKRKNKNEQNHDGQKDENLLCQCQHDD